MILTGTDQLWVADITYIRLRDEFVFLAVDPGRLLTPRHRLGAGPNFGRRTDAGAPSGWLWSRRIVQPGLVHHSDRGTQYASTDYTDLLTDHGITISMSRKGNPWDNAACESFMKTLKYEEVYRNEYRDLAEARASIREFLEKIYNRKASALGSGLFAAGRVRKPTSRSLKITRRPLRGAFCMSFLRHARSIGPMWVLTSRKAEPVCRLPLVGTGHRLQGRDRESRPCSSSAMSSHRLSLGGLVSTRARLRFAGCVQFAMKAVCRRVEEFSANGEQCLNCLCQPRGQAHFRVRRLRNVYYRSSAREDFVRSGEGGLAVRGIISGPATARQAPFAQDSRRRDAFDRPAARAHLDDYRRRAQSGMGIERLCTWQRNGPYGKVASAGWPQGNSNRLAPPRHGDKDQPDQASVHSERWIAVRADRAQIHDMVHADIF